MASSGMWENVMLTKVHVVTSPVLVYHDMYFCVTVGLNANRAITYLQVYESTTKMHWVNVRV